MLQFFCKSWLVVIALMLCAGGGSTAQADGAEGWPGIQLTGLLDGRVALTDTTRSWQDRGFGKVRYGGDRAGGARGIARLAEAAVVVQTQLTWDLTAFAHLTAGSQQRQAVDAVEAYVAYKPAPTSALRFRAKAGAFFPPISLENTGLAWTSPFTISSSAINTWVAEEMRVIGAEASVATANDAGELSFSGAVFGSNDPAGSLLAWRGWVINDRKSGLSARLPLAALSNFAPGGSASGQVNSVRPFAELDDRAGYYLAAAWAGRDGTRARAVYYDNQANTRVFDGRQYAWYTQFGSFAVATTVDDYELVAQGMVGNTKMAVFPTVTVVDNDFASAFLLASRQWDKHRLSARLEYFEVKDLDRTRDDPNGEHGRGLTLSYVFRPSDTQRLTLEVLNVRSTRQRRIELGLPARANETLVQASYRFFFSTK